MMFMFLSVWFSSRSITIRAALAMVLREILFHVQQESTGPDWQGSSLSHSSVFIPPTGGGVGQSLNPANSTHWEGQAQLGAEGNKRGRRRPQQVNLTGPRGPPVPPPQAWRALRVVVTETCTAAWLVQESCALVPTPPEQEGMPEG